MLFVVGLGRACAGLWLALAGWLVVLAAGFCWFRLSAGPECWSSTAQRRLDSRSLGSADPLHAEVREVVVDESSTKDSGETSRALFRLPGLPGNGPTRGRAD